MLSLSRCYSGGNSGDLFSLGLGKDNLWVEANIDTNDSQHNESNKETLRIPIQPS